MRVSEPKQTKLGEMEVECTFIRYASHRKAYRLLVIEPNNSILVNSIIESWDALFDKTRFVSIYRPNDRLVKNNKILQGVSQDDTDDEFIGEVRELGKKNYLVRISMFIL